MLEKTHNVIVSFCEKAPGLGFQYHSELCVEGHDPGCGLWICILTQPFSLCVEPCKIPLPGVDVWSLPHRLLHLQRIKEMRHVKVNSLPHSLKVHSASNAVSLGFAACLALCPSPSIQRWLSTLLILVKTAPAVGVKMRQSCLSILGQEKRHK